MEEHKPTDLETEIVKLTAVLEMYNEPNRRLNEQEKSKAIKLKVLLGDLTAGSFSSADGIRVGNEPISDSLTSDDLGLP